MSKKQVINKPVRNAKGQLVKGSTANPNGRPPKGYSIAEQFRFMLGNTPNLKKAFAESVFKAALEDKDVAAMRLIISYTDGMPIQYSDVDMKVEGKYIVDLGQVVGLGNTPAETTPSNPDSSQPEV